MKRIVFIYVTLTLLFSVEIKAQDEAGKCKSGNCVNGKGKWITKDYTYEGEFKNGLKDGYGVCRYKNGDIYDGDWKNDLKDGYGIYVQSDKRRFDGDWSKGYMVKGKFFNWRGDLDYEGTPDGHQAFSDDLFKKTMAESKLKRESEPQKECKCDKCNGTGKFTFKSAKIWYSPVYENGKQVGTATNHGWEYEDIKCTRCLGTGKCN